MSAEKKIVTKHNFNEHAFLGVSYDFYGHTFARVTGESIIVKVFFFLLHIVHTNIILLLQ